MRGARVELARHPYPRRQVAVFEEVMLGEPHEIESEPIEHDHPVHDRGVQARHVHARFRRVAEIVDGADAKGWTDEACSPFVRMFAGSATRVARSRKRSRSVPASRARGPSARSRLSSAARPWPSPRWP